ncbi:hypothetical protein NEMIN01_1242 [Nematocida minor]|uniref:uncharacterized protein n=1 Tax=Nematocida minor TaxID=1912983 RepID=UPI00221F40B6|nr:uncharacterized protein NEMIN01_1242 [Nematocida minor]KAI5190840.1 hypothetical protein NEMIN01_1242 [Nematocida minor]
MNKLIKKVIISVGAIGLVQLAHGRSVPFNPNKLNLLQNSNWMVMPANTLFIYKGEENKTVEAPVVEERLALEAPGKEDLKYGPNVKSLRARLLNLFKKSEPVEEEKKIELVELVETENEIEQERVVEQEFVQGSEYEAEVEQSSHAVVISAEKTDINNNSVVENQVLEVVNTETEEKVACTSLVLHSKAVVEEGAFENVAAPAKVADVVEIDEVPVVEPEIVVAEEKKEIAVVAPQPEEELYYFWVDTLIDGTTVTRLITRDECIRLNKEARAVMLETEEANKFLYNISNNIEKAKDSAKLLTLSSILYKVASVIMNSWDKPFSALRVYGISVFSLFMPIIALIDLLDKRHHRQKGIMLSIYAILAVYQIKSIIVVGNNATFTNTIIMNMAAISALCSIVYLFAIEYAARTKHNEQFPGQRRKNTARAASFISLVCIGLLAALAYIHPFSVEKPNLISQSLFIRTPQNIYNIIHASIAVLSYCASIMILNMRPTVDIMNKTEKIRVGLRIGQILVAMVLGMMLTQTIQPEYSVMSTQLIQLALIVTGLSILFGNGARYLPEDSVVKRHRNTISMVIFAISAKILLSLAVYLIIKKLGMEKEALAFVMKGQSKLSQMYLALNQTAAGKFFFSVIAYIKAMLISGAEKLSELKCQMEEGFNKSLHCIAGAANGLKQHVAGTKANV